MRYFLTFRREDSRSSREGLVIGNAVTKPGETPVEWVVRMNHPYPAGELRPPPSTYTLLFWEQISEHDASLWEGRGR